MKIFCTEVKALINSYQPAVYQSAVRWEKNEMGGCVSVGNAGIYKEYEDGIDNKCSQFIASG